MTEKDRYSIILYSKIIKCNLMTAFIRYCGSNKKDWAMVAYYLSHCHGVQIHNPNGFVRFKLEWQNETI